MILLNSQRHLFDVPEEIAYFNCAYNSPQLNESRVRLQAGVSSKSHPWERTPKDFFDDAEKIRKLSSSIFGGDRNGFAVIPSASYGVSTAARAIEPQLHIGDKILIIAEEFPSNVLPWRRTAQETGAEIITTPVPEDGNWTNSILNSISHAVKVVALSTCHWTNGAYIDLSTIAKACRDNNTFLVVDATQTLGAMPFSIENIQPDFLVAACCTFQNVVAILVHSKKPGLHGRMPKTFLLWLITRTHICLALAALMLAKNVLPQSSLVLLQHWNRSKNGGLKIFLTH